MTTTEHKIAVKFEVYHDEMNDIVKLFNRALDSNDVTKHFSNEELGTIISFIDDFKALAIEHAK
jgi:UDP-glucose 6-dehydrogenase|tara:strand:+ start:687 stop:878 length:192 start_codon:yes stop_codon:yes gene_type:complete